MDKDLDVVCEQDWLNTVKPVMSNTIETAEQSHDGLALSLKPKATKRLKEKELVALKEAFRVLKPGGKLITSTGFVNKETLAALPEEAQRVLTQKRPDVFEDLYEDTVLAGFSKIDSVISGCWYTDDDESTIADLARSLGVNLKFTSYTRYCTKEQ